MINIKTRVKTIILVILLIACFMLSYFMLFSKNSPIKAIDSLWTEHTSKPLVQSSSNGDVVIITSASQLAYISANINSYRTAKIKLCNDINLSLYTWVPISKNSGEAFSGRFDGQNYTISNLKTSGSNQFSGLFGYISGATIQNVVFKNCNVTSVQYSGIVTGYSFNSTIEKILVGNSSSIAKFEPQNYISNYNLYSGGISGCDASSKFTRCYVNNTTVNAYNTIKEPSSTITTNSGGICGGKYSGNWIILCYFNAGTIKTNYDNINYASLAKSGGIVGTCSGSDKQNYISIQKCYNIGNVSATTNKYKWHDSPTSIAGGICGNNSFTNILSCYNRGSVHASSPLYSNENNYPNDHVYQRYVKDVSRKNDYDYLIIDGSRNTNAVVTQNNIGKNMYNRYRGNYTNTTYNQNYTYSSSNSVSGGIVGYRDQDSCPIDNCYNTGKITTEFKQTRSITIYFKWVARNNWWRNCNTNLLIKAYILFNYVDITYRVGNIVGNRMRDSSLSNNYYKNKLILNSSPIIEQTLYSPKFDNIDTTISKWGTLSTYAGGYGNTDCGGKFGWISDDYNTLFSIDATNPQSIMFKAQFGAYLDSGAWVGVGDNVTYYTYNDALFPASTNIEIDGQRGTQYSNMKTTNFAKTLGSNWAQDSSINGGYPYLVDFYW